MGSHATLLPILLDSYRISLEARIDFLNAWMVFWTAVVIFGLNLELWSEFAGPFFETQSRHCKWVKSWIRWYARIGILLVVAGVGGELYSEGKASDPQTKLRDLNKWMIAGIESESSRANERASANARETARINVELAQANGRVEALRQQNNESAAKIEDEKRKRVELAASLLPRDFWDQSWAIAKLSKFPIMKVQFEFVGEREPRRRSEQIYGMLTTVGWRGSRRHVLDDLIPDGIRISPGNALPSMPIMLTPQARAEIMGTYWQQVETGKAVAEVLRDSLKRCSIDAETGGSAFDLPTDTLLIEVGLQPNHVLEETLKELGPREPTLLGHVKLGSNSASIPEGTPENKPQ